MTEPYRATDISVPDLTKRKIINWPEKIATLEIHLSDVQADLKEIKNEAKYAMVSLAESNEKLVNSFNDNKRLHKRIDEQDEIIEGMQKTLIQMDKTLLEIQLQNKILIDFSGGVRKAGWVVVTCGGAVLWWIIQRWVEQHGR